MPAKFNPEWTQIQRVGMHENDSLVSLSLLCHYDTPHYLY
jgi:hypothetical protein